MMVQGNEKQKEEIIQLERTVAWTTSNYERLLDDKEIAIKFYQVYMRFAFIFLYQFMTEQMTRVWNLIHTSVQFVAVVHATRPEL